jgi:murein DD-endopeptidase MepM/ murein hydrolase activator NlpD
LRFVPVFDTLKERMKHVFQQFIDDLNDWGKGWRFYIERHVIHAGVTFESRKDILVDILMARRGTYQWPFLHISLVVLAIAGAASAPILASSYPGALPNTLGDFTPPSAVAVSLDTAQGVDTQKSDKPRDQVVTYTVKQGDTLQRIADQFGVSVDTIKWANDMKRDALSIDQSLKIPPVTGIVYKVREGDTIYTIAKKYRTEAQKIVNFPFNDFADTETFALNIGQTLIIPDGLQPEAAPATTYFVPTVFAGGSGQLMWPTGGAVTQYPSWYHMALDIANPAAPGVAAADNGIVVLVKYLTYDYGQHVIIDHGNGTTTLYGHLQAIYVKPGDKVAKGQIIGKMGSTGRSTGTHLHFEVRKNGAIVNPQSYLK